MTRRLPKYVSEFQDRHGKMRVRFRRKGQKDYYFSSVPWTPAFNAEYKACLAKEAAPALAPGADRVKAGTFNALIVAYYGSAEFRGRKASTQATYRNMIERFRKTYGDLPVAGFQRQHIKQLHGSMSETPAAADNLLDRLKALMALAVDIGMRPDNPTFKMKGYGQRSDGFHTWTEDEIAAFEKRHPIGTKARLALALMLYTGQRRSDAVTMGRQHIDGGKIKVRQIKTNARLAIPMHPTLRQVIDQTPRENLTFLVTAYGQPFTAAGFGNWFRERCDEAGLPQCSAHGLRKAAARRLAEARCTNQMIKAITGHRTDSEVSRYTADADQELLAEQAMEATYGMEREQKTSNPAKRLDTLKTKPLKRNG